MENNTPSQPPFFINQKVVAIKTSAKGFGKIVIEEGTVLTVRKCYGRCIFFNEVINKPTPGFAQSDNMEPAYRIEDFAPYNPPRHESVEIAEDILNIKIVEERSDVITEKVLND